MAQDQGWCEFSVPTGDGKTFSSRSLDGKVTVVSVWASWCSTSRRQLPVLTRLQDKYGSRAVQVLAFSFDHSESDHNEFLAQERVNFPTVFARNGKGLEVVRDLQAQAGPLEAVPILLIYDKSGRLVSRTVGFLNMAKLEGLLDPLLKP